MSEFEKLTGWAGPALSPATPGERAEAGPYPSDLNLWRSFRPRVRGGCLLEPHFVCVQLFDVAPLEQAAAPHPDPLPLQVQRKGRGNAGAPA